MLQVWQRARGRRKAALVAGAVLGLVLIAYPLSVLLFAHTPPPARPRPDAVPVPTPPPTLAPSAGGMPGP